MAEDVKTQGSGTAGGTKTCPEATPVLLRPIRFRVQPGEEDLEGPSSGLRRVSTDTEVLGLGVTGHEAEVDHPSPRRRHFVV